MPARSDSITWRPGAQESEDLLEALKDPAPGERAANRLTAALGRLAVPVR